MKTHGIEHPEYFNFGGERLHWTEVAYSEGEGDPSAVKANLQRAMKRLNAKKYFKNKRANEEADRAKALAETEVGQRMIEAVPRLEQEIAELRIVHRRAQMDYDTPKIVELAAKGNNLVEELKSLQRDIRKGNPRKGY